MQNGPLDRGLWNSVLKQIVRRTRNDAEAEDLLHSAYLRLEQYRTEKAVENPAGFLVRTALNIKVDNYRHEQLHERYAPEEMLARQSSEPLQDEVMYARARLERVKVGLQQLTPRTREIFLMHRLDNLKYREIAVRLEISESAVEKHIAKAILFLTKWVEGW